MEPMSTVVAYYLLGICLILLIMSFYGYNKNWKGIDKED